MANLSGLDDRFRDYAQSWFDLLHAFDPRFVITSGYRSEQEQQDLWNRFQRGEGGLYTVMPPGRSQHERGFAMDLARIGVRPQEDDLLTEAGELWRSLGNVWGGTRDPVHFEAPKWLTGRA